MNYLTNPYRWGHLGLAFVPSLLGTNPPEILLPNPCFSRIQMESLHACSQKSRCLYDSHLYFLFHFSPQALIPHLWVPSSFQLDGSPLFFLLDRDNLLLSPDSQKFAFFHLPLFKALVKVSHQVSELFYFLNKGAWVRLWDWSAPNIGWSRVLYHMVSQEHCS